jgi:putative transposase
MASTYLCLYYHLIFATKDRESLITPAWRSRLHQYLGGAINNLGGQSGAVGGTADHVHVLAELRATHALADFMRELKKGSSMWIHQEIRNSRFAWQEGYAAFSVSASVVDEVRHYIENQDEHHRNRSSFEELRIMLERARVPIDERYFE